MTLAKGRADGAMTGEIKLRVLLLLDGDQTIGNASQEGAEWLRPASRLERSGSHRITRHCASFRRRRRQVKAMQPRRGRPFATRNN